MTPLPSTVPVRKRRWPIPLMNPDYADMLSALSDAGADHLVVGARALAVKRATGRPQDLADVAALLRLRAS